MMAIAMTKEATKDAEADATCIPYASGALIVLKVDMVSEWIPVGGYYLTYAIDSMQLLVYFLCFMR